MTWSTGSERIRELLEAGELEGVEPSLDVARRLLSDAEQVASEAAEESMTILDRGILGPWRA